MKNVKHERTPVLKKYIALPLILSPERDEELLKITDQVCHLFFCLIFELGVLDS
jgi:hypothetical protein